MKEKVEPVLNNNAFQAKMDVRQGIPIFYTSQTPKTQRSGSYLRSIIYDVRADFATVYRDFFIGTGANENTILKFKQAIIDM